MQVYRDSFILGVQECVDVIQIVRRYDVCPIDHEDPGVVRTTCHTTTTPIILTPPPQVLPKTTEMTQCETTLHDSTELPIVNRTGRLNHAIGIIRLRATLILEKGTTIPSEEIFPPINWHLVICFIHA